MIPRLTGLDARLAFRLQKRVQGRVAGLRSCVARHRTVSGTMKVALLLDRAGRVAKLILQKPSLPPKVVACARRVIKAWQLGRLPRRVFLGPFVIRVRRVP